MHSKNFHAVVVIVIAAAAVVGSYHLAMQIVGVITPSLLLPLVLELVIKAYGIGEPTEEYPYALPAPQATLMAEVFVSIFIYIYMKMYIRSVCVF